MKKTALMLLIIILSLSIISCSGTSSYEPVESTAEEERVVMTLSVGNKRYDVKYELYRALFLNYRDEVSGGDDSVWQGDGKQAYIDEINALILERASAIYAVFAVCEDIGYDLYSKNVNKQVNKYITESIEGTGGYGTREKYIDALRSMNLNWSVQDLLLRYAIGMAAIDEHYIGDFDADDIGQTIELGELKYTQDDVKNYYNSDDCIRVLRAHIQADAYYDPMEYALRVKNNMENATSESAVSTVIINTGLTAASEVKRGYVMGRYNLDPLYYGDMTDAAFALSPGEVSDPIQVNTGDGDVIFIIYRAEKSDAHFNECYTEIAYVYLTDKVGEITERAAAGLASGVSYTEVLLTLDYTAIRMNETQEN